MDVSSQEDGEGWISRAFGVPSVPEKSRPHYPFSRDTALVYRLKLAVVLLNAACALFRMDEPCLRLAFVLHCWLVCVTCEAVYKYYPWREPLNVWMWRLRWAIPFWCLGLLSFPCVALLILAWSHLAAGCEMPHPRMAVCVCWLCCMLSWPLVREGWSREEGYQDNYDQFSALRPTALTLPGSLRKLLAALRSPSLLTLLTISSASWVISHILPGLLADVLVAAVVSLAFAVLCCHRLPEDVGCTTDTWNKEVIAYTEAICKHLENAKNNLEVQPFVGGLKFNPLAVQVPLLQREARILLTTSRTLIEDKAENLENLTTAQELIQFRETLDHFGPYTTECCVS